MILFFTFSLLFGAMILVLCTPENTSPFLIKTSFILQTRKVKVQESPNRIHLVSPSFLCLYKNKIVKIRTLITADEFIILGFMSLIPLISKFSNFGSRDNMILQSSESFRLYRSIIFVLFRQTRSLFIE